MGEIVVAGPVEWRQANHTTVLHAVRDGQGAAECGFLPALQHGPGFVNSWRWDWPTTPWPKCKRCVRKVEAANPPRKDGPDHA